ncbi:MAG: hypothetical protein HYZ75_09595 [Elusimicrobia bacterium]|nr:hypothetical protein [Elusimicrobiota bacterium]
MEDFKVAQFTKELVAIRLQRLEDPSLAAAELIRKTLHTALKALPPGPERGKVIEDAVRGGMQGLILADQDVPRGGVAVVEALAELAQDLGLDPSETLMSGLRGLAGLRRLVRPDQLDKLRHEIDSRYDGAGEAFCAFLHAQPDPGRQRSPAN